MDNACRNDCMEHKKRRRMPSLDGAGDGNRTHVTSLEGWSSAIELHPPASVVGFISPPEAAKQKSGAVDEIRTRDIHLGKVALYH